MSSMTESYRRWWEAFRKLGELHQRGWQKELAEKTGCSTKHISMVYSGKAKASIELQEKISEYFGVPYYKMVEYGEEILKVLEKQKFFPHYTEVMSLPRSKRFDRIVEIAKEQTGCPFVVFNSSVKEKYEKGELTEKEVYEHVKKCMEAVQKKGGADLPDE